MTFKYNTIIKYEITACCLEPLHIGNAVGSKEEVLIHPIDEVPFIQASSISGVFRDYFTKAADKEKVEKLFGDGNSKICFTDGRFEETKLLLEFRPRLSINKETGTCDVSDVKGTDKKSGHKFNMEYIGAGAKFKFSVYLYDFRYQKDIEDIFAALNSETIQLGGQKSNGCGYIKIENLKRISFDMTKGEDRKKWMREDVLSDQDYVDITNSLQSKTEYQKAYEIMVEGCTEGELLVKGIAVMDYEGEEEPDAMNMKNANGDYIIPGSSLKGAIRNQMEKIAAYLGKNEVIEDTFGTISRDELQGKTGNISFFDTIIEEKKKSKNHYRIHIDKFTGGVMERALFSEQNVSGAMKLLIHIADRNSPQKSCGLLLLALRDLAIGTMSLGSGYSIGKGIMKVSAITVLEKTSNKKAVIDYQKKKIEDENGLISGLITVLQA